MTVRLLKQGKKVDECLNYPHTRHEIDIFKSHFLHFQRTPSGCLGDFFLFSRSHPFKKMILLARIIIIITARSYLLYYWCDRLIIPILNQFILGTGFYSKSPFKETEEKTRRTTCATLQGPAPRISFWCGLWINTGKSFPYLTAPKHSLHMGCNKVKKHKNERIFNNT